ncbi:MAG: glucose 1-dehydrogenase [Nitrososphaerota archaeon]|nr:glucose 1-dehydrogenase [Nitrososphaerota archaeon]MDG6939159.1 glucose 1-dehydrogenase [Nitrososphaerota archaeon]
MKAILVTPEKKGSVRMEDVPPPEREGRQALLKPLMVGFDRTDLDINDGIYGEAPHGSDYLVAAHECLSRVEEAPDDGTEVGRGDLVVPTVRRPDGCANCARGESDMCTQGGYMEHGIKGLHGFASELAVSDAGFLVRIPEELKDIAVLLEPMSIAEKGVFQTMKIQERLVWQPRRALVLGAGPLGLLTCFLLRVRGLEVDVVATRSQESLKAKLAQRAGATYVNARETKLEELGSFDVIMEDTGVPEVAVQAQRLLNPNGVMCLLGIYGSRQETFDAGRAYTDLVLGNRVLFGSVNANRKYFEMGVQDFARVKKAYPGVLNSMLTSVIEQGQYQKAYSPSEEDIKTVIRF